MLAIGAFQPHQHAQALGVVIEPAPLAQGIVERFLSRMTERRVADIMGQAQRLGQILVQPQRPGDHPADLRYLKAVGQADAVMVAIGRDEHLGLVAQAPEGDRMDDPVAVALEIAARAAGERTLDRKLTPPAAGGIGGVGRDQSAPRIQSTAASAWIRVQS